MYKYEDIYHYYISLGIDEKIELNRVEFYFKMIENSKVSFDYDELIVCDSSCDIDTLVKSTDRIIKDNKKLSTNLVDRISYHFKLKKIVQKVFDFFKSSQNVPKIAFFILTLYFLDL